jgi:short-subunit dehydrogenase
VLLWLLAVFVPVLCYKLYFMYRKIDYTGKTVWITGASSGIGEHLAYEFAKHNAHVLLSGRNIQELQRVHSKIAKNSTIIPLDLSDANKVFEKAYKICQEHNVNVLINNAGVSQRCLFKEILNGIDIERKLMEINYFSVVAMTKAAVKFMKGQGGQVVAVSSVAGLHASPGRTGYSAAKAGIIGYYESLRSELKDYNIHVCNLLPGLINTNISINALASDGNKFGTIDPLNKNGYDPDAFARLAVRGIYNYKNDIIITQKRSTFAYLLKSFSPSLCVVLLNRMFKKHNLYKQE